MVDAPPPRPPIMSRSQRRVHGSVVRRVMEVAPFDRMYGRVDDKNSWGFDWSETTTSDQISAAQALIASIDPQSEIAAADAHVADVENDADGLDLLARLDNATVAQISAWVSQRFTAPGQAKVITAILVLLARQRRSA